MKLTERDLRSLTKKILAELLTRKSALSVGGFAKGDVEGAEDYTSYGDYGYDYMGDDGLGESEELDEEDMEAEV